MDAVELLAREDEFKRLNKQLEKKTESLMKEIEKSMQKPDIFSEFSSTLLYNATNTTKQKHCCTTKQEAEPPTLKKIVRRKSLEPHLSPKSLNEEPQPQNDSGRIKCDCCDSPKRRDNDSIEFLYAFVSVNVKDNILPPAFAKERVTVDNVCKFMASKIKLMQEQINKLQNVINKKSSQCEGHMSQLAEFESERLSLLNKTNNMKSSTADMRAKYMVIQKKYEEKEKLYKEQRSESDKLSAELKKVSSKTVQLEARCATQEQLIDSLRQQLGMCRKAEKEFRDSTRALSATHESSISRLEQRIKSLTTRIDRQTALINNLKKQNILLSTEGAVRGLEKEYCEFISQDF